MVYEKLPSTRGINADETAKIPKTPATRNATRTYTCPHTTQYIVQNTPIITHTTRTPLPHDNLSINPLRTLKLTTPPTPKAGTILHILAAVLTAQFFLTTAHRSRHPSAPGRL